MAGPSLRGMSQRVKRQQVLAFRVRAQQLDRTGGSVKDTSILDLGVQDTGPDGALWALALRGVDVGRLRDRQLVTLWTLRGAPHVYRRADVAGVAAAVAPMSDADAGKRIFDASKALKAAGIANVEALDVVAAQMRAIVTEPTVKGEMSSALTAVVDEPYLRFCRPCNATHLYEQTFRLAAIRAGLELQPGTSPPVLERIAGFKPASRVSSRLDVIRGYLRLNGPATPQHVAAFIDAPIKDVKAHWPDDAVEIEVEGDRRWVLESDLAALQAARADVTALLGPFDLYLQAKDRDLLIPDAGRAKALWPVIGRPGAILVDGEIVGSWRPRKSGKKLTINSELVGTRHQEAPRQDHRRRRAARRISRGRAHVPRRRLMRGGLAPTVSETGPSRISGRRVCGASMDAR